MLPEQKDLYARISQFQINEPHAPFPFSVKLAWEYQWSENYTYRAIEEYKKFMFLVATTDQELSPSTVVDRVWHLHLLYTHSYWNEFCQKIIQKNLHHYPAPGGVEAGLNYYQQYCQTLEFYRDHFGTPPPDIWNQPTFKSEGALFQWVDRVQYWIIPKPSPLLMLQGIWQKPISLWKTATRDK
ncbi:MAG: glycine-rich domain-containing protein [Thainema sp.]